MSDCHDKSVVSDEFFVVLSVVSYHQIDLGLEDCLMYTLKAVDAREDDPFQEFG